jgi:hypothetical protein
LIQGRHAEHRGGQHITLGGQKKDGTGDYNLAPRCCCMSYYRLRVAEQSLALR